MPLEPATNASVVALVAGAVDRALDSGAPLPSLEQLAEAAHMSPSQLRRVFAAATGTTPRAYAEARRAERLRERLAEGDAVADAIAGAGFGSTSRVYERTGELLGMRPAELRRGAPGERVTYTLTDTSLGCLVVAATGRGVCLVAFGEDDASLVAEVRRRFPRAEVAPAEGEHAEWVRAVVRLVDAPASGAAADVPFDVRGTVFQQQVWRALREIPAGTTVTYAQLAAAIGRPTATRAVAQACGGNPLAVVVPCHRVIGADGSLTGYRWGVERKRELLAREGRASR
jgi:AraC family transcriptional regulator of adaptative response/methylated-DNA-[protein]-cysteine methyltransferase